jgi:hypothetical protein
MCYVHIRDVIRSAGKRRRQSIELPRLRPKLIELRPNVVEQEFEVVPVLRGPRVINVPGILPVNVDPFRGMVGTRRRMKRG